MYSIKQLHVLLTIAVSTVSLISPLCAKPSKPYPYGRKAYESQQKNKRIYNETVQYYTELAPNIQLSPKEENERLAVLLQAIVRKDLNSVKKLIESGIDPNLIINLKDAFAGQKFYEGGIYVEGHDYKKPIPLVHYAAIKGDANILGYLMQKATGVTTWNPEDNNLVNLVGLVIKNTQEPGILYKFLKDIPDEEREYYLKSLVKLYPKNLALISALLDRFKNTFNPDILLAGAYPRIDAIKLLIDKYGAHVNAKTGGKGNSLLYRAVRDKKLGLVKELLTLNADVNICNNEGEKPIDLTRPESELEQLLEDAGASRDYKCEYACYNYGQQGDYENQQALDETYFQKLIRYATGPTNYKCS